MGWERMSLWWVLEWWSDVDMWVNVWMCGCVWLYVRVRVCVCVFVRGRGGLPSWEIASDDIYSRLEKGAKLRRKLAAQCVIISATASGGGAQQILGGAGRWE